MNKVERVNAELKKIIGDVIDKELQDPRLKDGLISIIKVDCDPDLTLAKVYYSFVGNKSMTLVKIQTALESASNYLRRQISKQVELRKSPELRFVYDESMQHAMKIDQILKELKIDNDNK